MSLRVLSKQPVVTFMAWHLYVLQPASCSRSRSKHLHSVQSKTEGIFYSRGGCVDWASLGWAGLARCNVSPLGQAKPVRLHLDPQFWAVSPLPPFDWVSFLLASVFSLSVYAMNRGFCLHTHCKTGLCVCFGL